MDKNSIAFGEWAKNVNLPNGQKLLENRGLQATIFACVRNLPDDAAETIFNLAKASNIFDLHDFANFLDDKRANSGPLRELLKQYEADVVKTAEEPVELTSPLSPPKLPTPPIREDLLRVLSGVKKSPITNRPDNHATDNVPSSGAFVLVPNMPLEIEDDKDVEEEGLVKTKFSLFGNKKKKNKKSKVEKVVERNISLPKSEVSGKVTAWAIAILLLVLLVISGGFFLKFGSNNSEDYSTSVASDTILTSVETCTTSDQNEGVVLYTLTPIANIVDGDIVLETTQSYLAIKYGGDFIVAVSQSSTKLMSSSLFIPNTVTNCVSVQSAKVLTDAAVDLSKNTSVMQLAYRIDTSHWSGWLVIATMIALVGAALLSLFMTGSKLINIIFFTFAVFTVMFDSATTITAKWPGIHYFLVFLGGYVFCVMAGGKEELQEQKESFDAGNQLKLPEAMKSLFESLSRMFGIAGRFDWTYSGIYATIIAAAGAIVLEASPLFRVFENRLTALLVAAFFIVLSFMMEAWRRGLPGDWWTFAVGFVGLFDFGVYYMAFNTGIRISDFSSNAIAIFGWLITLVAILGVDFGIQAYNSRTELQRDRLADGALFGSAMKLIAVLGYIFVFVMAG